MRATDAWLPCRDSRFAHIVECLTSLLSIKALNAHVNVERPFGVQQEAEQSALTFYRHALAHADAAHRFWSIAIPGVGAALGVGIMTAGELTAGGVVLFLSVSSGLMGALSSVHHLLQEMYQAQSALKRMGEVKASALEHLEAAQQSPVSGGVVASKIEFTHRGSLAATLRNLAMKVEPGEHVALIGRSGEGKSTFTHLLARMFEPDAGSIQIGAHAGMELAQHRRSVLLVPRESVVFSTSLRENVRLWDTAVNDQCVLSALNRAGLGPLTEQFAVGLDTLIGQRGNLLSAGERQRLGIARIYLRGPQVLILDEATSALDAQTEAEVLADSRGFMGGRTMIIVTHRVAVAPKFDKVFEMRQGRVIATDAAA